MMMHVFISCARSMSTALVQTRRVRVAFAMLCTLLALIAKPAWANCSYTSSLPNYVTKVNNISGNITVGRDQPVGTVLYMASLSSASSDIGYVMCTAGSYSITRDYLNTPYPLSGYTDPTFGSKVYKTSVQGIGVVYTVGSTYPIPYSVFSQTYTGNVNVYFNSTQPNFNIRLIKISDQVGTGTINGADLPTTELFIQDVGTKQKLRFLLNNISGQVNIGASTCATPDQPVNMGTHVTTELNGKGSTTSQCVPVDIQLNNCPAYFGYGRTVLTNYNTGAVTTLNNGLANSIQYSIAPTNGIADSTNGVMNLSSGGASGVGIQLANASGTPIQFNTKTPSGLALNTTNSASYTIKLQARYYQTGTSVTAGAANANATVTLTYL